MEWHSVSRFLVRLVLAGLAYFAGARLGYVFGIGGGLVMLWPPSGIVLGLLLLAPMRSWPPIALGALLGSFASDRLSGYTVPLALFAAFSNVLESVIAARVVTWWIATPVSVSSVRAVFAVTIGAAVVSNAMTALVGALVLTEGFGMRFWRAWFVWWAGDGLGMVVFTPVLLAWAEAIPTLRAHGKTRKLELAVMSAALLVVCLVAFGPARAGGFVPGPYAALPIVFWAAIRFGPAGAATAVLVVAAFAIWYAALAVGPFGGAGLSEETVAFHVYAFVAACGVSSLFTAAALDERRIAVRELWHSEERYRTMLETATDAILTIDAGQRIQFANAAVRTIFGYAPSELVGRGVSIVLPDWERSTPAHEAAESAGALATARQALPVIGRHKDGRDVALEISVGEYLGDAAPELTAIIRDISEKHAAEQALRAIEERSREAQKMEAIGKLAGGIAHDFNNVLTVIQGTSEMMLDEPGIGGRNRDDVAEIQAAAKRAAALTRQLLAFSRRQVIAPRILRIQDTLAALQPMLARLIGEHVAIAIAPSNAASVRADPSQIEQIILNLALNARDAMPGGGTLSFAVDEAALDHEEQLSRMDLSAGNYVRLTVSDTGFGMSVETMAHIFEPFFTTKPIGQGTGLGLATVHGAVKQNHGAIEVRSAIGRGTSFVVYLPRVDAPLQEAEPPRRRVADGTGTILVVEDEDAVRKLTQRVLEKARYQVLLAASPTAALDMARVTGRIDVLLSDIVLPEMSGTALAEKVRRYHPGIKVLFMSGYTDDMIVRHGLSDRTIAMVEKPFTPETLLRMLQEVSQPSA